MKLKQIATINAGYPFRGKIPEQPGSPVVAVQMKDASPMEGVNWPSCVPTALTGKRSPQYLHPGDILVAARGSRNYATQIDHALPPGMQAVAAPHFFVVSLQQPGILPDYLTWLLNQGPLQRYFDQNAEGTLTKSIRRSVLEDAPVVIPALPRQQAIIQLANTLRAEQRLIQQLLHNGERMMSSIANDLFDHKDVMR
ncbi:MULTISPECIES: restriction endonuclease subunit S [unclassified Ketobacter]|uniref:restriction endonuclease subunit S n=1 Tax=unclassified Ketobacter TaxID=2639109 RepID=UPI000F0DAB24|nr:MULTISPECIES: restriction endonuclease subunit S [unclassified Ketobacter]RLT91619.1 MAG: restriction endonuclease subunit S [Ketobacter sp. GenoA1]RLT96101.1 MAG: restriction endonuclease subunit S [Ketobacter sp.]